jgi:hypothetical protein
MKRCSVTLPTDLVAGVEEYLRTQDVPPAFTTFIQAAVREYLVERGFLRTYRPLKITPAAKGSGLNDVSVNHDKYLAEAED